MKTGDLIDSDQADIRNPLSLLAHNRITASQFLRSGISTPETIKSPQLFISLSMKTGDLIDSVKFFLNLCHVATVYYIALIRSKSSIDFNVSPSRHSTVYSVLSNLECV